MRRLMDSATDVMTGLMFICVLTITALFIRREFFASKVDPTRLGGGQPIKVPDWSAIANGGHRIGPANASITLVVFSDFECPFCGRFATGAMKAIRRQYPNDVAVLFRHFPLGMHRLAYPAARAAECAAAQHRFEEFHDVLFAKQDSLGLIPFSAYAREAGVTDIATFESCSTKPGPVPAVDTDLELSRRLKIPATPTVFVNGWQFRSSPDSAALDSAVRSLLPRSGESSRVH